MGRGERSLLGDPTGSELRIGREKEKETIENKIDGTSKTQKQKKNAKPASGKHPTWIRMHLVLILLEEG